MPTLADSISPFDAVEIPTGRGLIMTCGTAEPGTASDENLKLLAKLGHHQRPERYGT